MKKQMLIKEKMIEIKQKIKWLIDEHNNEQVSIETEKKLCDIQNTSIVKYLEERNHW